MGKQPLIILAGPTASGKTSLSIRLAKELGGAVVSADSMQVYRHMDIGSAKASPEEMQGVPHYLIDVLEPWEEFNVTRFQEMAQESLAEIYANGQMPIVVGGTGFYIQALLYGIDFGEGEIDLAYRRDLEALAQKEGPQALHEMLRQVDAPSAERIHANNVKRVVRALEFYHLTGERISEHNDLERQREAAYEFRYFVLTDTRERLYGRIDQRVDAMVQSGLVQEVQSLLDMGCTREMTSMQGLGYKEMIDYLEGRVSLEEAVRRIKRDTRHFAKRQLTWFRREKEAIWVDRSAFGDDEEGMLSFIRQELMPT